jgi:polyphenol oxidase
VSEAEPGHRVAERRVEGEVPLWVNPEWEEQFPWLVQGTTGRGSVEDPFDLGLSGEQPVGAVLERWRLLLGETRLGSAVHARQVHGTEVWLHDRAAAPGLLVMSGVDGHITNTAGLLLTVSIADCVPVFLVDPVRRVIALLHAGWRGVAGGVLERAFSRLHPACGSPTRSLWLHCGPAICGACYTVGPEVHRAVNPDRAPPDAARPIDLRAALVRRALDLGVEGGRCSISSYCTRCDEPEASLSGVRFFSHRGGDAARQMAVLGLAA